MGVLPGIKATGRDLNAQLHELNGRTGTRLGALWTTLVVVQVAAAVAVLPVAFYLTWQVLQFELSGPGFAAEKFGISQVALPDDGAPADASRVRERQLALMARLGAEPGVEAVTFSSSVPGFAGGARIQFADRVPVTAPAPWDVSRLDVAPDMLDVYGAEMLAGRRFTAGDTGAANAVIVNQTFAQWLSGDGNALGVRFRYLEQRRATRCTARGMRSSASPATFRAFRRDSTSTRRPSSITRPRSERSTRPSCPCDSPATCRPASACGRGRSRRDRPGPAGAPRAAALGALRSAACASGATSPGESDW